MANTIYDPTMPIEQQKKPQNMVNTNPETPATPTTLPGGTQAPAATPLTNPVQPEQNTAPATPTTNNAPTYTPSELPTYRAQTDKVNETFDAKQEFQLAQLQTAYDNSAAQLKAEKEKIPQIYDKQANATSAGSELSKQNFNEYAAGSGLNTGAASQVELARMNQLQANLSAIRLEQANAEAEVERQLSQLYVNYQNEIKTALAENDYQRAMALYEEYQRQEQSIVDTAAAQESLRYQQYLSQYNEYVRNEENRRDDERYADEVAREQQRYEDESAREDANTANANQQKLDAAAKADAESKAKILAQYGDFSGYLALGYTPEEVAGMREVWLAANPDLAAAMGGTPTPIPTPDDDDDDDDDDDEPEPDMELANAVIDGWIFIPGYGGKAGEWLDPEVVKSEQKKGKITLDTSSGKARYYATGYKGA